MDKQSVGLNDDDGCAWSDASNGHMYRMLNKIYGTCYMSCICINSCEGGYNYAKFCERHNKLINDLFLNEHLSLIKNGTYKPCTSKILTVESYRGCGGCQFYQFIHALQQKGILKN
jgi:hypothetical protein